MTDGQSDTPRPERRTSFGSLILRLVAVGLGLALLAPGMCSLVVMFLAFIEFLNDAHGSSHMQVDGMFVLIWIVSLALAWPAWRLVRWAVRSDRDNATSEAGSAPSGPTGETRPTAMAGFRRLILAAVGLFFLAGFLLGLIRGVLG